MKKIVLTVIALFFVGCGGYSPSLKYAKKELNSKVYTEVAIKVKDPENSVIIKDSIKELVVKKFNSTLVPKKDSTTRLYIDFNVPSFSNLQYDVDGYVTMKRANVSITTDYESDNKECPKVVVEDKYKLGLKAKETIVKKPDNSCTKRGTISSSGSYDFSTTSTTLTDQERFVAVKNASSKALDELISKLSVLGAIDSE